MQQDYKRCRENPSAQDPRQCAWSVCTGRKRKGKGIMALNRLRGNFHTHTVFCDGSNTAQEMAEQALALGFTHLGFSGHMDPDIRMDLAAYDAEIRRLQALYRQKEGETGVPETVAARGAENDHALNILRGVELDGIYETQSSGEKQLLDGMDYLIGSTHFIESPSGGRPGSVDDTPERLQQFCREEFGGDYYRLSRAYYETEAKIFERTGCTFVGHFDLVTRFNDALHFLDENDPRYYLPALETMELLVSKGLPFEINCGAFNRGRKAELYPNRLLLKHLREMGGQILINSDAHQKELLDGGFEAAVRTAVECGFTHTIFLEHDREGEVVRRLVPLDL